jgi:hypothetical protein
MENRCLIAGENKIYLFSPVSRASFGSGPASYVIGAAGYFAGKGLGDEADYINPSSN